MCGLNQRHMLASMNYKKDGKREPTKVKNLIQLSHFPLIKISSSQFHIFLSFKMKQPPNFPTRVLTIFHLVSSKAATRSPSLLYCFKYIRQFFKESELEVAICVGSQGFITLFKRIRQCYKNSY